MECEKTKVCTKCGEAKAVGEFYKKSCTPDGLQPHCKLCKRLYARIWGEHSPAHRVEIVDGKKACTRCGEIKPVAEFAKQSKSKSGIAPHCKDCQRGINWAYRKAQNPNLRPAHRVQIIDGKKKCSLCKCVKLLEDFYPCNRGAHGPCTACSLKKGSEYRMANPGSTPAKSRGNRRLYLMKAYGMTLQDYDEMLAAQGGGCAICGGTQKPKGHGFMPVDHCHAVCPNQKEAAPELRRAAVRGILCQPCNSIVRERERLAGAVAYLDRYAKAKKAI